MNKMVTIPAEEYDRLREAAEDLADLRAYDRAKAALAAGEDELVPADFAKRLISGESPLRVWRELRGLSQVKLGAVNNGMVAVNEGLQPGDRVVVEGTDRLRAGAKVEVVGGSDVIPATRDKTLGAGAPAGTTPPSK